MFAQFRHVDGPHAGETKVVGNDFVTLGRHPGSDVLFAESTDQAVSVRHAAVFKQGGGFLIRDLGSTNGTYLNGRRVRGDRSLEAGDVIQLGPTGPRLEFTTVATLPLAVRIATPRPTEPTPPSTEIYRPRSRTTEPVLRAYVPPKPGRPWLWMAGLVVVFGGLAASGIAWRSRDIRTRIEQQRTAVLARIDDHLTRLTQARTSIGGLTTALGAALAEGNRLRASVVAAERPTEAGLDSLIQVLGAAARVHEPLLRAAGFDPGPIVALARAGTAVVIGQRAGGLARSGSAVVVSRRADTVWLGVPRPVVVDSAGGGLVRIAVIMQGARQAQVMGLVRGTDSAEVAMVAGLLRSPTLPVATGRDSAVVGEPVVAIGYPFGADSLGDWRRLGTRPTPVVGTVAAISGPRREVDGYGVDAPIGSPVYGADGKAVGVVLGSAGGRWTLGRLPPTAGR